MNPERSIGVERNAAKRTVFDSQRTKEPIGAGMRTRNRYAHGAVAKHGLKFKLSVLGSALLLGPGLAAATVQQLDGKGANAAVPVEYAQELLKPYPGPAVEPVRIMSPNTNADGTGEHAAHKLTVSPTRVLEAEGASAYIHLSFDGGMVFSRRAFNLAWSAGAMRRELTCTYDDDTKDGTNRLTTVTYPDVFTTTGLPVSAVHSSGGFRGDSYVVYRLDLSEARDFDGSDSNANDSAGLPLYTGAYDADPADPPPQNTDGNPNNDVEDNNNSERCDLAPQETMIAVDVVDYLAIPAGPGAYSALMSLHSDPDEAQAGTSPSPAVWGEATIVKAVDGLDVGVEAANSPAVAHVGTSPQPFLQFSGRRTGSGLSSTAILGYAKAEVARHDLFNPQTGDVAGSSDLIPPESLAFTVEGDFSIGAFNLSDPVDCPARGAANAVQPVTGNLKPTEGGPADKATLAAQGAGTYHLCVQIDVQGPNSTPIPAGTYNGTITSSTGALASGVIGQIRRNGTTVKLAYLTVAEKYNQRLIIVNEGANDARYDIGPFVTEDGVSATPKEKATGMVPAGGKIVVRVKDIVSFSSADGRRHRAAATLSMNADVDEIQVATSQVNLVDGSTDTVVYHAVEVADVQ